MPQIDLLDPIQLAVFFLIVFLIIFVRYLVVAGAFHLLFFNFFKKKLSHRILDSAVVPTSQMRTEIYWSGISALVFSLFALLLYVIWAQGWSRIYFSLDDYPLWYLPLSIFLALFIQDTYYYWLHRWMHSPKVYRRVHKVHHNSVHTSVFTSFSFHPSETILQALILPLIIIFLPLHIYAIGLILLFMTLSAVVNHAGVEVYTLGRFGRWLTGWVIGATHHDQHHRKFTKNYGLYFTFWDRWMNTEAE